MPTIKFQGNVKQAGYLSVRRVGRRNQYQVNSSRPLRHSAERHHKVGELLTVLAHSA